MEQTKLTIHISCDLLDAAKEYARQHNTTLTRLITTYLHQLNAQTDPLADAPIVRRLSGILSAEASITDYYEHLEEKHNDKI